MSRARVLAIATLVATGFVYAGYQASHPGVPDLDRAGSSVRAVVSVAASDEHSLPRLPSLISTAHAITPPTFAPPAPPPPRPGIEAVSIPTEYAKQVRIRPGDTLMHVLTRNRVASPDAHAAVSALAPAYDLRRIRAGQSVTLRFGPITEGDSGGKGNTGRDFLGLSFKPSVERLIRVRLTHERGYWADEVETKLTLGDAFVEGRIDSSLFLAAKRAKLPVPVLMELIRVFSFDVDFQRDIQPGDGFRVLFERRFDETGEEVDTGELHYAAMRLSGKTIEYFRYTPKSGVTDYFDRRGQSVRKTLMRTPIDGARLSSRYGKRRHPILGYTKMHRGNDFAARKGTPIMAAGDGVIDTIGRKGAYGKYIRLRHNSTYKTAYAHMSRYAKGMRRGTRVKQGQTIGYVGSTGRSTGAHLHYEVLVNGRQTNPRKVKLPSGEQLRGTDKKTFLTGLPTIRARIVAATEPNQIAQD